MHRSFPAALLILLVLSMVLLVATISASTTISDLGTLGGPSSVARDIDVRGQIVGGSDTTTGEFHAFLWMSGTFLDLGTLGGSFSEARGINDHSDAVGYSETALGEFHAFQWNQAEGMIDLGTLGGDFSVAEAVNNAGQVVGFSKAGFTPGGFPITRAFIWSRGVMTDLGTLGGRDSFATDINDLGHVVGGSDLPPDANGIVVTHAFLWTPEDGMIDLGSLGPFGSAAYGINRLDVVVGQTGTQVLFPGGGCCEIHAFRWTSAEGMVDIGTFSGGMFSAARDVADSGDIVGLAETGEISPFGFSILHAFLWRNGALQDLGTLGASDVTSGAEAVNRRGDVAGGSDTADGSATHAVVWHTS